MAGIYLHIPYCKQACTYCNFHFSTSLHSKEKLLAAMLKEIETSKKKGQPEIQTIYFGGGTPSILTVAEITMLLDHLRYYFKINTEAEITLEANPDDINPAQLAAWKDLGINRLSLGVQSFSAAELQWMNRAHNASQAMQSICDIREAGFDNFSIDLIYGSPLLGDAELLTTLEIALQNNIPHVSAYALTVEPKTALGYQIAQKKLPPMDDEKQARHFEIIVQQLTDAGFEQYEISNFAKPGYRSRHNSSYWQGKPYFGFGPGAHSFDGKNTRRWNVANNALYIKSLEQNIIPFEEEVLTLFQQMNESIMISLRTVEGINLAKFADHFGKDNSDVLLKASSRFELQGLICICSKSITLTSKGKFLADGIAAELFF